MIYETYKNWRCESDVIDAVLVNCVCETIRCRCVVVWRRAIQGLLSIFSSIFSAFLCTLVSML
jgi:hypothetical protein